MHKNCLGKNITKKIFESTRFLNEAHQKLKVYVRQPSLWGQRIKFSNYKGFLEGSPEFSNLMSWSSFWKEASNDSSLVLRAVWLSFKFRISLNISRHLRPGKKLIIYNIKHRTRNGFPRVANLVIVVVVLFVRGRRSWKNPEALGTMRSSWY